MLLVDRILGSMHGYTAHLLFMTDGDHNGSEPGLDNAVAALNGHIRCDVRILGGGAKVTQMRDRIATPLGGQINVIADGQDLAATIAATVEEGPWALTSPASHLLFECKPTGRIVAVTETSPQTQSFACAKRQRLVSEHDRLDSRRNPALPGGRGDRAAAQQGPGVLAQQNGCRWSRVRVGDPSINWTESGAKQRADGEVIASASMSMMRKLRRDAARGGRSKRHPGNSRPAATTGRSTAQ